MGKRGPKPTPTTTLKVRGSWRADLRSGEPEPSSAMPLPPAFLQGVARDRWNELAPKLNAMGLLGELDGDKLAAYCVAWAKLVETTNYLNEPGNGHWYESEFGPKKHPASAVQDAALDKVNRLGALFGMSPSDRVGLKPESTPKKDDGKSSYFTA